MSYRAARYMARDKAVRVWEKRERERESLEKERNRTEGERERKRNREKTVGLMRRESL